MSKDGLSEYKRLGGGGVAIRLVLPEPVELCEAIEVFCIAADVATAIDTLRSCGLRSVHRPKVHGARVDEHARSEFDRLGPPFIWRPWSSDQGSWRPASELPGVDES